MPTKQEQIEKAFKYYLPKDDQSPRYTMIRNRAREFAIHLTETCPDSRELSLALTKLEECVMWANVAISRNE